MVSLDTDNVVLDINNQHERISRNRVTRAPNPNLEVFISPKPLPRVLPPLELEQAPTLTQRPATLPHPERGLSDLSIVSDTHKPESVKPSCAQDPDTLGFLPPLEVLSPPGAPPKEGERDKTTASVAPASPIKPKSGSVHTHEKVIPNPTAEVGRALDTSTPDYRVMNTVGNEEKTPLRDDHVNKTEVPLGSSSEPSRVTSSTYAPSRVEKAVSSDLDIGSDRFMEDRDEELFGKSTDHVGIAGLLLEFEEDSVQPSLRDATPIWTQFGRVEGKRTPWRTFASSDATSKHRDARY